MSIDLHTVVRGGIDHNLIAGLDGSEISASNDQPLVVYRDLNLAAIPVNNMRRYLLGGVLMTAAATAGGIGMHNIDKNPWSEY